MSGTGAKKRLTRVPTSGSVGSSSGHKIMKPLSSAKLSNSGVTLKGSGMDTNGDASKGEEVSDSKMNTPQAKHFNNGVIIGSPFSSINYDMEEEEEIFLPSHKSFSLDKAWIDPKIIKTQVEVAVKKSFALNINLLAVEGKSAMAKTQVIRKLFSRINGFGGVTILSKFEVIIRSTFTSEASIEKTTSLAKDNNIIVNTNLKRQGVHSDQAMPKKMIIATVAEFEEIKLIKIQLIGLWQKTVVEFTELEQAVSLATKWSFLIGKDSVCVAMAVEDHDTWTSKDQFRMLLFILLVRTTAHDLSVLLDGAGGKTCIINHSLETGNRFCCAVVGFESDKMLESAFHMEPILGGMKLSWARLDLVQCKQCGKFSHSALECDAEVASTSKSSKSFKRVVFDENLVFLALSSNNPYFGFDPSFGFFSSGVLGVIGPSPHMVLAGTFLKARLGFLECSVELLVDKMFGIVSKLENLVVVPPALTSSSQNLVVPVVANVEVDSDMALNVPKPVLLPFSLVFSSTSDLGLSSSKILISKMGCLESKLMALETSVCLVLENSFVWRIATCNVRGMNNPAKQANVICWHKDMNNVISIVTEMKLKCKVHPWIANRFSDVDVFVSGLDLGYLGSGVAIIMDVALAKHVYRISEVPCCLFAIKLLFKNKLSVSILGLYAGASASMCFLQAKEINVLIAGAVNKSSFVILGSDFNKDGSCKSASFKRCGALGLVNSLVNSVFLKAPTWSNSRGVVKTINYLFVSPNLVNAIVDCSVLDFKEATVVNTALFVGGFLEAKEHSDLDAIFHKLKLLVFKLVKASHLVDYDEFVSLLDTWGSFDSVNAFVVRSFFLSESLFDSICSALSKVRKSYHALKLLKSKRAENSQIRSAINKRMKSFELNKGHTIRSVLEQPFCKVVLNHLVVGDEIILEPNPVKSKVDEIMKGWTWRHGVVLDVNNECFNDLFSVVSDLPNGKAAGLSGISNELELVSKGVLMNTCPITLIKIAHKILSKILSDRISLVCSKFDVLYGDNFSILKSTTMQSSIFAVGLVVENALEKNQELWLVLQDMRKAYNFVGWEHLEKSLVRIKMCGSFIRFFKGIHKIKRQESICEYRLVSHYILKNGHAESQAGLSSFLAASAYHILDMASKFYWINDISINNDKTVAIPINCRVNRPFLFINEMPITIAKKEESHCYLGIFFLTENLSKPSLAKTYLDVHFFSNMVLKKAVSDKQFLYLVSAVLCSIVNFRTQFSFILVGVCHKWDALIRKGLKLKLGLPSDFSSDIIHHLSFYGLKSFIQIQSEGKVASLICFVNSGGVLGYLFFHRSHDLQVLCWCPVHFLCFSVRVHISPSNNFLAGLICILLENNLSLGGYLGNSFLSHGGVPMSVVFDESRFFKFLPSFQWHGIAFVDQICDCHGFKRLDSHGLVPEWFWLSTVFINNVASLLPHPSTLDAVGLSMYMNGSFKSLDTSGCRAGAGIFFKNIGLGLGVSVSGSMSSTLAEMQAIVLALECVPPSGSIHLFSDSQSALDMCKSELGLICPDFCNQCWNNLRVNWCKMKGHSGVLENNRADMIADAVSFSAWCLPPCLNERFLVADSGVVSANSKHFVRDIFCSINCAHWEVGLGSKFLLNSLFSDVDWHCSSLVWHSDLHMVFGFTNKSSIDICTYFIKALHHQLPVAIRKHLYNRRYPSVLCLHCGEVEVLDHVFICKFDHDARCQILDSHVSSWSALSGLSISSSGVLQLLSTYVSDVSVFTALFKGFVFDGWYCEAIFFCSNPKLACSKVVEFVWSFGTAFRTEVWLVHIKYHAFIEKNGHILSDGSVPVPISGLGSNFSAGIVRLLGVAKAISVHFGYHKQYVFFSGVNNSVVVHINI
ncbi:hypothetical protein G9A89_003600 [Geosiphon pyriformis]|nr:hypothetical protein G9A89_003600 [Geosiphon pyriformis]